MKENCIYMSYAIDIMQCQSNLVSRIRNNVQIQESYEQS